MATIIDSLIVELGIDASKFTAGQQQAVEQLRGFRGAAQRTSREIGDLGSQITGFFRFMANPAAEARRHLEGLAKPTRDAEAQANRVSAAARRTGTNVEQGSLAAASGIRALAIAGLAAISVYEGLKHALESVSEARERAVSAGVGAEAAGLPVERYTQVARALSEQPPVVPMKEWEDWMVAFHVRQQQFLKFGIGSLPSSALGLLGIPEAFSATVTPDVILEKFAALAARDPNKARTLGPELGFTQEQIKSLISIGSHFAEIVAKTKPLVTPADVEAANKLTVAISKMNNEWSRLAVVMTTLVSGPLVKMVDMMTKLAEYLEQHATMATGAAGAATGAAIGGILGFFLGNPLLGAALGALLGGAAGGGLGLAGKGQGGIAPGYAGAGNLGVSFGTTGQGNEEAILEQIKQQESGGNPLAMSKTGASGLYQIVDSTWAEAMAGLGMPMLYKRAVDAPQDLQHAAALWLLRKYGPNSKHSWYESGAKLGKPYPEVVGGPGTADAPTATQTNQSGQKIIRDKKGNWDTAPGEGPDNLDYGPQSYLAPLGATRDGAAAGTLAMYGGSPVSNDNSRVANVTTGPINVYTQATDANGISQSINQALVRNVNAGRASLGLA